MSRPTAGPRMVARGIELREPPALSVARRRVAEVVSTWSPGTTLESLSVVEGGTSSLVYLAELAGGPVPTVVIKMAHPGLAPVRNRDVLRQAKVMNALGRSVPTVLFMDPGSPPDTPPLFGMTFVEGESLEPVLDPILGPLPSAEVLRSRSLEAVVMLARDVAVRPADAGLEDEPVVTLPEEIERWSRACRTVDPELVPEWQPCAEALLNHVPPEMEPVICHGDYRLGNTLAVGPSVRSVIDWEVWSVSDPRLDLTWITMFTDEGRHPLALRRVESLLSPREMADAYENAAQIRLGELTWFDAFTRFKEAAITALLVKHGRRRAVPPARTEELAASCPVLIRDSRRLLG